MSKPLPGLIPAALLLLLLTGCALPRQPNEAILADDQIIRNVTILSAPGFLPQTGPESVVR